MIHWETIKLLKALRDISKYAREVPVLRRNE